MMAKCIGDYERWKQKVNEKYDFVTIQIDSPEGYGIWYATPMIETDKRKVEVCFYKPKVKQCPT